MDITQDLVVQDVAYENTVVAVDGRTFVNCTFTDVALLYAGGKLPIFEGCRFEGIQLQFDDAAASTIEYLAGMSRNGFVRPVRRITDAIRNQVM
jgi:hypothetical protein